MRVKIQAGAEIDTLTKEELQDALKAWGVEITRGVRFRQFSTKVTADVAGNWTTENAVGDMGPREGMVWAVTRLIASGVGYSVVANIGLVYVNEVTASKLVDRRVGNASAEGGALLYEVPQLVLNGGDRVILTGTATASSEVTVSGAAIELPAQLAWQLL